MPCLENCDCVLCRELSNYETFTASNKPDKNFILLSPMSARINSVFETTKNLHDQLVAEINSKYKKNCQESNDADIFYDKCELTDSRFPDSVHKSVVYISGSLKRDRYEDAFDNIDESTVLTFFDSDEDKNVINVIFKNSFENANQIIRDINDCENACCDEIISDDDLPLGMEADVLNERYCSYLRNSMEMIGDGIFFI